MADDKPNQPNQPKKPPASGRGKMYPRGLVPPDWRPEGYWPVGPTESALAIFGRTPLGYGVTNVRTGKTIVWAWAELLELGNAEGLDVDDATPPGGKADDAYIGLPAEPGESHVGLSAGGKGAADAAGVSQGAAGSGPRLQAGPEAGGAGTDRQPGPA